MLLISLMYHPHYQHGYGHRSRSNWGDGGLLSKWAEGDIVDIPRDSLAFAKGRIPHSWSVNQAIWEGASHYRVVQVFSIGEGDEWYYRVSPIVGRKTIWDECSDRLHVLPGTCDYTEGWTLVKSAKVD